MVIYSKYNSNRKEEFQLITKIEKKDGILFSSKTAENEKAKTFLESLYKKYLFLRNNNFSLNLVKPEKVNDDKIIFEYKKGRIFSNLLFELSQDLDKDRFIQLLKKYFELIRKNEIKNEKLSPEFSKIFGNYDSSRFNCIQIGCLDLNFDNVIIENNKDNGDEFFIIDYEWTFEFPIPYKYIIFRALASFYKNYFFYNLNKNFIPLSDLYHLFEITDKERDIFIIFEYNFQKYVYDNFQDRSFRSYAKSYDKIEGEFIIPDYLESILKNNYITDIAKILKPRKVKKYYSRIKKIIKI